MGGSVSKLSRQERLRLGSIAVEIVRSAALAGAPVYTRQVSPGILRAEGPRGSGVFRVLLLERIGEHDRYSLAISPLHEAVDSVVGVVDYNLNLIESYPWMVIRAFTVDDTLFNQVEADVWSHRIERFSLGEASVLTGDECCEVLSIDNGVWLAVRHRPTTAVVAWYDVATGSAAITARWAAKWLKMDPQEFESEVTDWLANKLPRLLALTPDD
jgi:hypothetical protein